MTHPRRRGHLSGAELRDLARSPVDDGDPRREHLGRCSRCREEHAVMRALAAGSDAAQPCPDELDLVLFAAGEPGPDRELLLEHLHACRRCALDVDRLERLASAGAPPGREPASGPPGAPHGWLDAVRALAWLGMPASVPVRARSAGRGQDRFHEAMAPYREGRHDEAAERLEALRREGEAAPELFLFLGASLLAGGREAEAGEALAEAVARSPRSSEARFTLAQALLRLGEADRAAAELRRVARAPGRHRARAREQLAALSRLRPGGR